MFTCFAHFCSQATDAQLANIIGREHQAKRIADRDDAEREALKRGWDMQRIKDARKIKWTSS